MPHIVDTLHAKVATAAADAILSGEQHPTLTLTTRETADLLDHLATMNRRNANLSREFRTADNRAETRRETLIDMVFAARDAHQALERIRAVLTHPSAHRGAQAQQCATIARIAAEKLAAAMPKPHRDGVAQ
ncbi:hypothetical protein [Nocardia wallacei]|uniref:hypothetical protein n=1 Tax=Nocardia wallacei TaxID=480035 RepID=UPI002454141F|nr:hypothetical protein [Nocardia wallacei]